LVPHQPIVKRLHASACKQTYNLNISDAKDLTNKFALPTSSLVVGAPLAMSGAFMLVCFGFSFFSLVCATAFSAFFLMAALVLLTLGLLPLAVTAWAFKPKEFKHYSHAGLTACATCLERGSSFVDPGSDAPKIAIYQKVHQARGLLCTLLAKGSSLFSVVDSKIQQTEI